MQHQHSKIMYAVYTTYCSLGGYGADSLLRAGNPRNKLIPPPGWEGAPRIERGWSLLKPEELLNQEAFEGFSVLAVPARLPPLDQPRRGGSVAPSRGSGAGSRSGMRSGP